MTSSYDVIVIGSGAGGGTLVHRLVGGATKLYGAALYRERDFGELRHHDGIDTSFFPSIGAVNPALTAMANGLRIGDNLLERLAAKQTAQEAAGAL
jgi:choline dehydrogenase-like flavoprotein